MVSCFVNQLKFVSDKVDSLLGPSYVRFTLSTISDSQVVAVVPVRTGDSGQRIGLATAGRGSDGKQGEGR